MSEKVDMQALQAMNAQQFKEYWDNLPAPKQPKNGKWTVRQLVHSTYPELWAIWKTLPAPDFFEMNGEYSGYCPDGKNPELRKGNADFMFNEGLNHGYWMGKAFKPFTPDTGEGYNVYRQTGEWIWRHLRFGTAMADSLIDGKPAYVMYYSKFKTPAGRSELTDEIRKLQDGIYIGMGHTKKPDGDRSLPSPFILVGPVRPFLGVEDDDEERF